MGSVRGHMGPSRGACSVLDDLMSSQPEVLVGAP